ncbi:adenylate/guanylate cyclase domain-containing protein [Mycobacterium sp. 1164985.4]|uniref:adenylate/guanylate cyclase domain-containing protein n=1 Tax=Mycobacterium sp. 1164985.4 TaxID=1834069 RepID=UPI0007FC7131|nr:adenylate/guanylate cyclase domain-containing protein [Mycobacterium sp. 1164985.4]OBK76597.1 cyclase [Mycobacterium sp. 1164985.4]
MDRIWQWAWDRHGPRYSWAICAVTFLVVLPSYLALSIIVVAFQNSDHYVEAAAVTAIALPVLVFAYFLPGVGRLRLVEQWAAGRDVDQHSALEATYAAARGVIARGLASNVLWLALLSIVAAALAGASGPQLIQYGILGACWGAASHLIAVHSIVEGAMRPARIAIAGDTGTGDSLPRSRPTFAAWSISSILAVAFSNVVGAAMLGAAFHQISGKPVFAILLGCVAMAFAVPVTVGVGFAPSLRPIHDLAEGTERVTAGNYTQRLPVVQDDDLGALAASFNRMQAGLAERQRLQAAFGTYVDPALATKLLEQGDDVFTGERREVTVMFVDIRDFTPFAEANPAEDVVARLNALFEIVVPAVVDAGGHVNKFLGDGALAVFGAPNDLADHADAALNAAVLIQRLVAERFGNELRIGIGINTGTVIAGTIGGGSKLEFTLIGDTVNVAARVEQLTKTTGDTILITEQAIDALTARPPGLVGRGSHALKGKSAATAVFSVGPGPLTGGGC